MNRFRCNNEKQTFCLFFFPPFFPIWLRTFHLRKILIFRKLFFSFLYPFAAAATDIATIMRAYIPEWVIWDQQTKGCPTLSATLYSFSLALYSTFYHIETGNEKSCSQLLSCYVGVYVPLLFFIFNTHTVVGFMQPFNEHC